MMYKPKFEERGLVRAVVVVDIGRCGCIDTCSKESAEKRGNIWAVGAWRRDDDKNLQNKLEDDFDILTRAYFDIGGNDFCGCAYTYEYKKYYKF